MSTARFPNPIFVAIDTPDMDRALALAKAAGPHAGGLKVGLEFLTAQGPEGLRAIQGLGHRVFADTKFHANIIRAELNPNLVDESYEDKKLVTRLIHRYTAWRSDLVSPLALLRITKSKKAVKSDVFSMRFVVASMRENTFARAAYGTLVKGRYVRWTRGVGSRDARIAYFPPPFNINFCSLR